MKAIVFSLFLAVFAFGYICGSQARRYPEPFRTSKVPTFKQVQVMVGAEPDGIIGPNTIAKWDKAICNQEAGKWDFYYEGDKK